MKKIIFWFVFLLSFLFSFWTVNAENPSDVNTCVDLNKVYTWYNWVLQCCAGTLVDDSEHPGYQACIVNTEWDMWINMNKDCLVNGQCSYNIYKTLWIRKSNQDPEVSSFVGDIVLATTTFIWTVIAIVLVISGILYISAWITWNNTQANKAKKWIINSVIGLLLVTWSYAIIRLIQFIATAGWG